MSSMRSAVRLLARHASSGARRSVQHRCLTLRSSSIRQGLSQTASTTQNFQRCLCTTSRLGQEQSADSTSTTKQEGSGGSETGTGSLERLQFQAETRQLLDIVAKSLYSDKEVFIREVVSNSSDALEKLRHFRLQDTSGAESTAVAAADEGAELCIRINVDAANNTFSIQDNGIGMSRQELIDNLGTIARSGSQAFLNDLKEKGESSASAAQSIIGQFGVGFYSTFMVGDLVTVYTRSSKPGSTGYKWISDGSGTFEVCQDDSASVGSKIVVTLKSEESKFSSEKDVQDIVTKYSNFVSYPIYLNDKQVNTVQPLWMTEGTKVTDQQHEEFFKFIAQRSDTPRYSLHFSADAPIMVRSLLYVPDTVNAMFGIQHDGLALYNRRVLIQDKARDVIPEWLRFVKGVVDCEDIPLNLSRELLQDNVIIKKVRATLTSRVVRFLHREAKKDPEKYDQFFDQCGNFIREGIVSNDPGEDKEEIGKLMRFESSEKAAGQRTNFVEYVERMQEGQKEIFYLCTTGRKMAESSPYYHQLRNKGYEVIFSYEAVDDTILSALKEFKGKNLTSAEGFTDASASDKEAAETPSSDPDALRLTKEQSEKLCAFIKSSLQNKVDDVKATGTMAEFPAVITSSNISAFRSMKMQPMTKQMFGEMSIGEILRPTFQINPSHPVIIRLNLTYQMDASLAQLAIKQLYVNALIAAGVNDDPRAMLPQLNDLVARVIGVSPDSNTSDSSSEPDSVTSDSFTEPITSDSSAEPDNVTSDSSSEPDINTADSSSEPPPTDAAAPK